MDLQSNERREEFKKYLRDSGMLEAFIKVIMSIYEMEDKPDDPLDYIRTHMTETIEEKETLAMLKKKHEELIAQINATKKENLKIARKLRELKHLEKYGERLDEITNGDNYCTKNEMDE